ncbi:hypothetical protein [Hyalangium gracile]|uniref:hypothetical protein n=1 Tax=Hyalangium gracile TaxID=394092 RepID=UPI001CCA3C06|nr:hypothetical protein [Hyalangium gracile]
MGRHGPDTRRMGMIRGRVRSPARVPPARLPGIRAPAARRLVDYRAQLGVKWSKEHLAEALPQAVVA